MIFLCNFGYNIDHLQASTTSIPHHIGSLNANFNLIVITTIQLQCIRCTASIPIVSNSSFRGNIIKNNKISNQNLKTLF